MNSDITMYYSLYAPDESVSMDEDFHVDYDRIIQNVEDLNALAGEGVGQVQHTVDGARIKVSSNVHSMKSWKLIKTTAEIAKQ